MKATAEEIKRTDKAHARADEAVAMQKQGHIITSCDVLLEDENDGVRVTWDALELETWEQDKEELVQVIVDRESAAAVIGYPGNNAVWTDVLDFSKFTPNYRKTAQRARIIYRDSAVFRAAHPDLARANDPYAGNRERETG